MSGFEVFGAVGGGGALAGVLTSCVDCFKYVQLGKSFGDDFQKAQVRLDNQALRLAKWGQSVGLYGLADGTEPANLPSLTISISESKKLLDDAQDTLEEIARLFVRAVKKSKKFEPKAGPQELELYDVTPDHDEHQSLHKRLQSLASGRRIRAAFRQKEATVGQVTRWALYDKEQFEMFIGELKGFIDDLIELFPPQVVEVQRTITTYEVENINDTDEVKLLVNAAGAEDAVLLEVGSGIIRTRTGHVFEGNKTEEDAFAKYGDHIDAEYKGRFKNSGSVYQNNKARGSAIVQYGDTYGGLNIFQSRSQG